MSPTIPLQTDSISQKEWNALSEKKIYFGHMSVGYNIIDGVRDIMKKNPTVNLNIRETDDPADNKNGVFAHSKNGENGKPKSKIDAFAKTMENGMGKRVDIALFKFCYVDFNEKTDVTDVFNHYKVAMKELKKKFPNVTLLHATVPLTTEGEPAGIKDRIKDLVKKILGRRTRTELDALSNIKRNEYNLHLIKEYGGERVLDIAQYESTGPDGKKTMSKNAGTEHPSMVPGFTTDGGHLNQAGRLLVGDRILARLARIR